MTWIGVLDVCDRVMWWVNEWERCVWWQNRAGKDEDGVGDDVRGWSRRVSHSCGWLMTCLNVFLSVCRLSFLSVYRWNDPRSVYDSSSSDFGVYSRGQNKKVCPRRSTLWITTTSAHDLFIKRMRLKKHKWTSVWTHNRVLCRIHRTGLPVYSVYIRTCQEVCLLSRTAACVILYVLWLILHSTRERE